MTTRLLTTATLALAVWATPFSLAQPLSPSLNGNPATPSIETRRPEYDAAVRRLTGVQQSLRAKYEASDDYMAARKDLEAANKEYTEARNRVLAQLKNSEDYRKASEEARVASERVEAVRNNAPPTTQPDGSSTIDPKVVDAAQKKLEEGSSLTKMEAKALSSDDGFTSAQSRLKDAWAKMNGVRAKYQTELRADKDWQAARADLERMNSENRPGAAQQASQQASQQTAQPAAERIDPANDFSGQGQFGGQTGGFSPSNDWWLYGAALSAQNNANRGVTVVPQETRDRGSASGNTGAGPDAANGGTNQNDPTRTGNLGTPNGSPGTTPNRGNGTVNGAPGTTPGARSGGPAANPGSSNRSGGGPSASPGTSNNSGGGPSASPGTSGGGGGGPSATPGSSNTP